MPLDDTQKDWLNRFTAGAANLTLSNPPPPDPLNDLRKARALEEVEERALKDMHVAMSTATLEAHKEGMRKAFDMQVTIKDKPGKKSETLKTRDAEGRQERAFDKEETSKVTKGPEQAEMANAQTMMGYLVAESDRLAAVMVMRSRADKTTNAIVKVKERLFDDGEIMDELYTPLVRELVLPENFVPKKFSATQKMIDGSNDYYIAECKEKGKQIATGGAALTKGVVALGTAVTTTVLTALGAPGTGQVGMSASNTLSKDAAAQAISITNGISALLTAGVEIVNQVDDLRNSGDFSTPGFKAVANGIAVGIGKVVAGSMPGDPTANMNLGLVITDSIQGAVAAVSIVPRITKWVKDGGDFPVDAIIEDIGDAIGRGLSAASDQTSGETSTWLAKGSALATGVFVTAASAQRNHLLDSIQKGEWRSVFQVMADAGTQAAKTAPVWAKFAADYNEQTTFSGQAKSLVTGDAVQGGVDKATGQFASLIKLSEGLGVEGPSTVTGKRLAEIEEAFEAKKKALADKVDAEAMADVEKRLEKERKEYQASLDCLGSDNPSDAEYKSIAKLIEQIERDRAIWTAILAISSGGLAVATAFVPGLKMAGELTNFIGNMKAAADRAEAVRVWTSARRDAASAVSPYATSVENMIKNQGEQLTHYSVQAAANAIKFVLAAGELSPYAPAFKVAGAAVGAAASTADLIYKMYKQTQLRKAWKITKAALEAPENRKLALQARELNPTLAKYTLAYGALIEESPVAMNAMNRIGLDRETLARAGDKVGDVKTYLEKLYVDDNVVLGQLGVKAPKTKVPAVALTVQAWSVSHMLWTEKENLATANPGGIVARLRKVESLAAKGVDALTVEECTGYVDTLTALALEFRSFVAVDGAKVALISAQTTVDEYAELAEARAGAVDLDLAAKVAKAQQPQVLQQP